MLPYLKIFSDMRETVDLLSDTEAGRLLKSLMAYVNDDVVELSGQERLVYSVLVRQIDRDREKYQSIADKNRVNGAKGGRPKNPEKPNGFLNNPKKPSGTQKTQEEEKEEEKEEDKEKDKRNEYIARVFALLNQRTGKHFRATGQSRAHVNARFSDGYTLEDFEVVIDKKCAEWLGGDMEKYLRPETLFGSKFDGYLNEPVKRHKSGGGSSWSFEDFAAEPQEDANRVYVEPENTEGGFPF